MAEELAVRHRPKRPRVNTSWADWARAAGYLVMYLPIYGAWWCATRGADQVIAWRRRRRAARLRRPIGYPAGGLYDSAWVDRANL